ncbi:MAG: glycosyltransferase family 2 protein [Pseudochelatococcus sp.]|jgi:N-acetylglucosaminyl-diphospho-decaprenol L-rhamnosyltransferase|uniref:glycosyltransferase family 2 protein n=1 Tax=Pseudochelatococcus sp. TaxID=2020869 RepID=UPI003D92FEE5
MDAGDARLEAVVVSFNSAQVLPSCLDALRREGARPIVVDNASGDDSVAVAQAHGARVIRNARNEGYGRANNIGIRAADGDYALVINPDAVLDPGALAGLLAAAERYPDAALLAPRIVENDGRFFFQFRSLLSSFLANPSGARRFPEGDCCAPFLSGAALLVRRDVFLAIGGFDENIFLFYEDDDLCRRLADAGRSLVHVHGATARHRRGASSAPDLARAFNVRWHLAWSRAYVSRKYGLPDPAPGAALVNGLKALGSLLILDRARAARYGGSAAGAWAWLRGRDALSRQGLEKKGPAEEGLAGAAGS